MNTDFLPEGLVKALVAKFHALTKQRKDRQPTSKVLRELLNEVYAQGQMHERQRPAPPMIMAGQLSDAERDILIQSVQSSKRQPMMVVTANGHISLTKRWTSNSGWAQDSWLWFVDIVNANGEPSKANAHGYSMSKYGLSEGEARSLAMYHANFFNWPIREFVEERRTTANLKEVTPNVP